MKSIPEKLGMPPELPQITANPQMCEDTLTLRLETPMMGGGVQAGDVDWERPIRASSIRGHLRSWWRLFCAYGLEVAALKEKEAAIFGNTEKASKIYVDVSLFPETQNQEIQGRHYNHKDTLTNKYKPFDFERNGAEAYALFPVMPKIKKKNGEEEIDPEGPRHDIAKEGLTFKLTLCYPETTTLEDGTLLLMKDDIRKALAGWIYFGGIGARTRRGLGTLSCVEAKLSDGGALPNLKELLAKNRDITLWLGMPAKDGISAWGKALGPYQEYRQHRTRKFGRSLWPEPDSLRQITGCSCRDSEHDHSVPLVPEELIPSFPRASLGLPIIYHFKDEPKVFRSQDNIPSKDPEQVQIFPARKNPNDTEKENGRMASPVITKGLYFDGKWYPAVIILPRKAALNVRLNAIIGQNNRKRDLNIPSDLLKQQDPRFRKLKPMQNADNAITGFENYIQSKDFTVSEVKE